MILQSRRETCREEAPPRTGCLTTTPDPSGGLRNRSEPLFGFDLAAAKGAAECDKKGVFNATSNHVTGVQFESGYPGRDQPARSP